MQPTDCYFTVQWEAVVQSESIARIPDFDSLNLFSPFLSSAVPLEVKVEMIALDAAADVFGTAPAVAGNIKFCSRRKDLRVSSNSTGPGYACAGGLSDGFYFSRPRNRQSKPIEFPVAALRTGTIAGSFNGDDRIGTAQRRENKMAAREHKQGEKSRCPENDPPFHAGTLIGNDRHEKHKKHFFKAGIAHSSASSPEPERSADGPAVRPYLKKKAAPFPGRLLFPFRRKT